VGAKMTRRVARQPAHLGEMSAFIAANKANDKMKEEFVEPLERRGRRPDAALSMQNAMKNPDEGGLGGATDLLRMMAAHPHGL